MTQNESTFHILLVEDEPINQKVVQLMLDNIGCTYDSANTGAKALELAKTQRYDLILMDIQLPDISGIDITKQLRALGITTPIIATTAYSFDDERHGFIAAGMNDVLAKPFRQQQIADAIQHWVKTPLQQS
jgi:CheY-like chemotaxis protein